MHRRRHTLVNTRDLRGIPRRESIPFSGGEFIVIDGPHSGLRVRIGEGVTTVGRTEENDLALTLDRGVSRRHAAAEWVGDRLYLRDLSSTNGTLVNGVLAQGRVTLSNLDVVSVGRSILQVVFDEPPRGIVYELTDPEETHADRSG
jgi:pSer/pThr/pTyr-binding forkhead associated (FHA) protein